MSVINCKTCNEYLSSDTLLIACPICDSVIVNMDAKIETIEAIQNEIKVLISFNDYQLNNLYSTTKNHQNLPYLLKIMLEKLPDEIKTENLKRLQIATKRIILNRPIDYDEYAILLAEEIFKGFTPEETMKAYKQVFKYIEKLDIDDILYLITPQENTMFNIQRELEPRKLNIKNILIDTQICWFSFGFVFVGFMIALNILLSIYDLHKAPFGVGINLVAIGLILLVILVLPNKDRFRSLEHIKKVFKQETKLKIQDLNILNKIKEDNQ